MSGQLLQYPRDSHGDLQAQSRWRHRQGQASFKLNPLAQESSKGNQDEACEEGIF